MNTKGLTIDDRINLKKILIERGMNFTFYSIKKISAFRDSTGDVWVSLPGIYSGYVNFTGSLQYEILA